MNESPSERRFQNEFGRPIRVSAREIKLIRIEIEGPSSTSTNDVTPDEARNLMDVLREQLEARS